MSLFGIGEAIQTTGSHINTAYNAYASRKAASTAEEYLLYNNRAALQNNPTYQVQGYQKAGLNPALMYTQGTATSMSGYNPVTAPSGSLDYSGVGSFVDQQVNDKYYERKRNAELETIEGEGKSKGAAGEAAPIIAGEQIKQSEIATETAQLEQDMVRDDRLRNKLRTSIEVEAMTGRRDPEVDRLMLRDYYGIDNHGEYDHEAMKGKHYDKKFGVVPSRPDGFGGTELMPFDWTDVKSEMRNNFDLGNVAKPRINEGKGYHDAVKAHRWDNGTSSRNQENIRDWIRTGLDATKAIDTGSAAGIKLRTLKKLFHK